MSRKKTTLYLDEDLLRAAKAQAEHSGREENEIFEDALRAHLTGFDVVEKVHERLRRDGTALSEEDAMALAYEELHAMRAQAEEAGKAAEQGRSSPGAS